MKQQYIRLCGIAALVLTPPAYAQTQIVLDLPLDWQVIQRNANEWAEVKVAGTVPANATVAEAKAELRAGLHGKCWADKFAPWLEKQTGKPASRK